MGGACLAIADGRALVDAAERAAALTMHALDSHKGAFEASLVALKPHPGAVKSAERLWTLLPDAPRTGREPLAIRTLPYVIGAGRDALAALQEVVRIELGAPADNPIWREGQGFFGGGSAFDTHRLAQVLDGLSDALLAIAASSERRIARLLDPATSRGLSPFLIAKGESAPRSSGLMIAQYTAASLVARMRTRIGSAGLTSPTCNGFEDAISLAPLSVERASEALRDTARVLSIESVTAARAIDLRGRHPGGPLAEAYARVRQVIAFSEEDRALGNAIERLSMVLRVGAPPDQASSG